MAHDGGNSGAYRRFSGGGPGAANNYKSWKKWAAAKTLVDVSKGTKPEAIGPLLFTLLEGQAADAVEHIPLDELNVEDGEKVLMKALDERYPEKEAADKIGEVLQGIFGLGIDKTETTTQYTGRAKQPS